MNAKAINQSTNLVDLVPGLKKHGKYYAGPCPSCRGDDRFNVKRTEDGDLWICRKCGGKFHAPNTIRGLSSVIRHL